MVEVKVPDIGDFKEVEVIELMVKVGDTIKVDQSLVTVESDKASMEIPSSQAGVIKEIKVKVGDKVAEGSLLLIVEADGAAAARIGVLGGHLYGSVPQLSPAVLARGVPVWMTEHFLDSVNKSDAKTSWATSIDDALAIAHEVHESLAHGQYNAYVHWWLVNSSDAKPTGLIDANNKPNHFGIGLKHYSYFVRPGFVRVEATAQPMDGVRVSAYGGAQGQAVIVLSNEAAAERTLTLAVNGSSSTGWTPYRSTAQASFERLAPLTPTAGSLSLTLPARSLTTLVNLEYR